MSTGGARMDTGGASAKIVTALKRRKKRKKNKRPARAPYDVPPQDYKKPGVPF